MTAMTAAERTAGPADGAPADTTRDADVVSEEAIAAVEEEFGRLFHRVRANWKQYAARVHPTLQPMGYKVLSMIVARGPVKAGELIDDLHTDKSVLSRQVRQLESLGLVESRIDERDARARLLVATPAAIERVVAVRAENQAELRARLATWRPDEVATFAELLARLAD